MYEDYLNSLKSSGDVKFLELCLLLKEEYEKLQSSVGILNLEINSGLAFDESKIDSVKVEGYDYAKDSLKLKINGRVLWKRAYIDIMEKNGYLYSDNEQSVIKKMISDYNFYLNGLRYVYNNQYSDLYCDTRELASTNSRFEAIINGHKVEVYAKEEDKKIWRMLYDVRENKFKYRACSPKTDEALMLNSIEFNQDDLPLWMNDQYEQNKVKIKTKK